VEEDDQEILDRTAAERGCDKDWIAVATAGIKLRWPRARFICRRDGCDEHCAAAIKIVWPDKERISPIKNVCPPE
jgi:hypothetical protein